MDEVRRPGDDELCGFVAARVGRWAACTVFGADLGEHDDRAAAEAQVRADGLACLAERWTLRDTATGEEEVVCILEADPDSVTVALGWYSMPGVPRRTLTTADLATGRWALVRR